MGLRVSTSKDPDPGLNPVNLVKLCLRVDFVDHKTMRAVVDGDAREEVEHRHLFLGLSFLVGDGYLLHSLHHLVQRFVVRVYVFDHPKAKPLNELFNLAYLLQTAGLVRKGAPIVIREGSNIVILVQTHDDGKLMIWNM